MPAPPNPATRRRDAIVIGGGHNGLVAAALLATAGRSVLVLERLDHVGGAAISGTPFPGVDVRLSRYAYLVSLFPRALLASLGIAVPLLRRSVASYTPDGDGGLLVADGARVGRSWESFHEMLAGVAERIAPTLLEPLRPRQDLRRLVGDEYAWNALFEEPLAGVLERTFARDLERGIVLTDATIGTFAEAGDQLLRQNRCFLYHVIGDGHGRWQVPAGGMGALSAALASAARRAGAEIRTGAEVVAIATDGADAEVECADGTRHHTRHVLAGVAPHVLADLLGEVAGERPEGSQLKINMLLSRLPRVRDPGITSEQAFGGTFHINEGYAQLQRAYEEAAAGAIPSLPPCELYCHSLTDPSILSDDLRAVGAQTLTAFGLHMPARLFTHDPDHAKRRALRATIASIDSVLAEPLEGCLWRAPDGSACLEAKTPPELERELAMPGGHIFHRDLSWPFAESDEEVGRWGVETAHANVWLCGAGAKRGGGVSGIPGHNAARAILTAAGSGS